MIEAEMRSEYKGTRVLSSDDKVVAPVDERSKLSCLPADKGKVYRHRSGHYANTGHLLFVKL